MAQMVRRDNNVVLLATTVGDSKAVVIRPRKRPSKTKTCAVQTRKRFVHNAVIINAILVVITQHCGEGRNHGFLDYLDKRSC